MTKLELASYLANLDCILNGIEDLGRPKPQWLLAEYNRCWDDFKAIIVAEHAE